MITDNNLPDINRLNYFELNSAGTSGGAIMKFDRAKLYLCGQSTFKNNTANKYSGAIHIENASAVIYGDNAFNANKADEGGAIYVQHSVLSSTGYMEFKNNNVTTRGGAIFMYMAMSNFPGNNTFIENHAAGLHGGAIYVENATAIFCMITGPLINVSRKRIESF